LCVFVSEKPAGKMVEVSVEFQLGKGIRLVQEQGGALFQRSLGLICPTGSSALLSKRAQSYLGSREPLWADNHPQPSFSMSLSL